MGKQKTNDEEVLAVLINAERARFSANLSESEFFEIFAAQQVLKDRDLSDKEIQAGNLGNGNDGGIDGLYFFINGQLIQDDITNYELWVRDIDLDIYIIQAKTTAGFGEDAIHKLVDVTEDLFTLSNNLDDKIYKNRYHAKLLEIAKRITTGYRHMVKKGVNLHFHYVYATQGVKIEDNTQQLTVKVENKVKKLFADAAFDFKFMGARELAQISSRRPTAKKEIEFVNQVLYSGQNSCICLVKVRSFYEFLIDNSTGTINRHIFEANVRDYQGEVGVNKEIRDTLENPGGENFWWLNNGITILTSSLTPKGNVALILESPEIVNGLQTSNEVYNYFSTVRPSKLSLEEREMLLRIIVLPDDDKSRDKIIKATNSQTKIPAIALKATDPVHRDIEQYLKPKGLYYDRRKNFYKNQGVPLSHIVSIADLAQAMLAIKLARPDDARARPSSILADDRDYKRVFSRNISLHLYYAVLRIMEKVEVFLSNAALTTNEKTNLRYYLALYVVCLSSSRAILNDDAILAAPGLLSDAHFEQALKTVKRLYELAGGDDNAAKGTAFKEALEMDLLEKFLPAAAAAKAAKKKEVARNEVSKKKAASAKKAILKRAAGGKKTTSPVKKVLTKKVRSKKIGVAPKKKVTAKVPAKKMVGSTKKATNRMHTKTK